MSTRWYPLFQPGNPQLRVFLPNFWMKLIRPYAEDDPRPIFPNRVHFIVSMEMTRHDVKNYLKKIYNVDTIAVRTEIRMGKTKEVGKERMVTKEDDYKIAYVTLPEGQDFTFPDIYPKDKVDSKVEDEKKQMENMKTGLKRVKDVTKMKPDLPGWFT